MLTRPFRFFQIIKALKVSTILLFCLITAIVMLTFSLVFKHQEEKEFLQESTSSKKGEKPSDNPLNLEMLNPLKSFESFYAQDLAKQLLFLGKNSRPDAEEEESKALIGLKGSGQTHLVEPGEKLYLAYKERNLIFSREPTLLWIKIKEIDEEKLRFDSAFILTSDETAEVYQEKTHGEVLQNTENIFKEDVLETPYFQSLEKVKWWHPDLFYEVYGGKEFESAKGSQRIEFDSQDPSIYFVRPGTILVFKDSRWQLDDDKEVTREYPIAKILAVTPSRMEIKVWEENGIGFKTLSILPEKIKPLNIKAEEIFSKIRQRTATQVSCKIGSKHALLKKGDWLLRTSNQWRLLKTLEEIEKYLSFELQGELFVFDGIEKNQGIAVFKGHLFDTMRVQMQMVRIPLATPKKRVHLKRQKHRESFEVMQEPPISSKDEEPTQGEEESKDELLRLTTPQKRHEFSK